MRWEHLCASKTVTFRSFKAGGKCQRRQGETIQLYMAHWPASTGAQALGLISLIGKGKAQSDGELPPAPSNDLHSVSRPSLHVCQSKHLHQESLHCWNWSHREPKSASVTDIMTDSVRHCDEEGWFSLTQKPRQGRAIAYSDWIPSHSHAVGVLGPSLFTTDCSGIKICQMLVQPHSYRTDDSVHANESCGRCTGWLPEVAGFDVQARKGQQICSNHRITKHSLAQWAVPLCHQRLDRWLDSSKTPSLNTLL